MQGAKEKDPKILKIITGVTYAAAADAALKEIDPRKKTVVLTPDRFTFATERRLLKILDIPGSLEISVHSFDRLFYAVCGTAKTMPAASAIMLLQKIISENLKELKCFKRSAEFPGFAEKIYGVISAFKANRVPPEAVPENLPDSALSKKLSDIIFLYRKYTEAAAGYLDIYDRMSRLSGYIASGGAGGCRVVLCGFDSLNALELDIVKQFLAAGCCVTAATAYREGHPFYPGGLAAALTAAAAEAGAAVETAAAPLPESAVVFRHLYDNPGIYASEPVVIKDNSVSIFEAENIYAEVRKAAEMISVYTRRGYRFSDIAVVCPCPSEYEPAVSSIFPQYGISFFISAPAPLLNHPLYSYIAAGVDAVAKGYAAADVLAFIKSPYSGIYGITGGEVNIFENYCIAFGITRGGFFEPFTFAREKEEEELKVAECVRKKLAAALKPFSNAAASGGWPQLINDILDSGADVTDGLTALAPYRTAELLRQGGDGFSAIAAEMNRIFSGAHISPRQFKEVLRRGCEIFSISAIPETQDCVAVGDIGSVRLASPKILFMWGACDGKFPAEGEDTGMINDTDIGTLLAGGVKYEPSALESEIRASSEVYIASITPKNALHISYPAVTPLGAASAPAKLISDISRVVRKNGLPLMPYDKNYDIFNLPGLADRARAASLSGDIFAPTLSAALRSHAVLSAAYKNTGSDGGAEITALRRALIDKGALAPGGERRRYAPEMREVDNAAGLFFYRSATKVSQVESFYSCAFSHFLEYGLRLKERRVSRPDAANIGTLLHAVLESFMKEGMKRQGGEVFDSVISAKDYAPLLKDKNNAPLIKRLRNECGTACAALKTQQEYSRFTPALFEPDFLNEPGFTPLIIKADGREIKLSGKIDRADFFSADGKKYARVIDYKSGASPVKFSYGGLYKGTGLQLMVYLAYLRGNGYLPAGAFYFRVHDGRRGGFRMNGVVCGGDGLPAAMDLRLLDCGTRSDIIPCETTAKGAYKKAAYVVTAEEMHGLLDYALLKVRLAAARIGAGECACVPLDGACKFCRYGGICLFDQENGVVRKPEMSVRKAADLFEGDIFS